MSWNNQIQQHLLWASNFLNGRDQDLLGDRIDIIYNRYSNRYSFNSSFYTGDFVFNIPNNPFAMNQSYRDSTLYPNTRQNKHDLFYSEDFQDLRREFEEDLKRKKTIRSRSKRYKHNNSGNHIQKSTYNNKQDRHNELGTSSSHSNTNDFNYNNGSSSKNYCPDDEINDIDQSHSQTPSENDCLDDAESIYDDDSISIDELKELFDLLKDEEDLTPEQRYVLGYLYESHEVVDKDYKQAIKNYKIASGYGNDDAMCNLGHLYELGYTDDGSKTLENYSGAFDLYEKAAKQENSQAQYNLATFYERGLGTKKNIRKAVHFYESAAKKNHYEAQANLGFLYFYGNGVKRDYKKAHEYYGNAADGGVPRAFFALGYMYYYGLGITKSHILASEYYNEALKNGYSRAQTNIDILNNNHSNSDSSAINPGSSLYKNNTYDEYFNIGDACLGGINVEQNIDLACQYYDFNINTQRNGSIERGLGMYHQYCSPDRNHIMCAINYYTISIQYGQISTYYFLGMLYLQSSYFKLARENFNHLLTFNPRSNVSYLFVKNEVDFKFGKPPVPFFAKISEEELIRKARQRFEIADRLYKHEEELLK